MTCPFLKEAQVKYCRTSAIRKLIPMAQSVHAADRCASEGYGSCPVFQQQPDAGELATFGPCPFLHETLMQYCGAAPVAKFIPYSESLLSRCGKDSHRYCDLYLAMSHPPAFPKNSDGIPLPATLRYSANHMWLDVTGDGTAYAGIDAFLGRALGQVERISFVWQQGRHRPTAVVTANGVDLEVTFPFPLRLTGCNLYLRANPSRLTGEPYTRGWLFEGMVDGAVLAHLISGEEAQVRMDSEVRNISDFLQQLPGPHSPTAADGGLFSAGLARYLDREQMLALFLEFFSPLREQDIRP